MTSIPLEDGAERHWGAGSREKQDVPPEVRVKGAFCSLLLWFFGRKKMENSHDAPSLGPLVSSVLTALPLSTGTLLMLTLPIGLASTLHASRMVKSSQRLLTSALPSQDSSHVTSTLQPLDVTIYSHLPSLNSLHTQNPI